MSESTPQEKRQSPLINRLKRSYQARFAHLEDRDLTFADNSPKQMNALDKTIEVAEATELIHIGEFLSKIRDERGEIIGLHALLTGPFDRFTTKFGEQLMKDYISRMGGKDAEKAYEDYTTGFLNSLCQYIVREVRHMKEGLMFETGEKSIGSLAHIDEEFFPNVVKNMLRGKSKAA